MLRGEKYINFPQAIRMMSGTIKNYVTFLDESAIGCV